MTQVPIEITNQNPRFQNITYIQLSVFSEGLGAHNNFRVMSGLRARIGAQDNPHSRNEHVITS